MKRKIKIIIFDLDGTLVDAFTPVTRSINYTMKKLGFPKPRDGLVKCSVGWGETRLLKDFVGEELLAKALRIYRAHHRNSLKKGTFFLSGAKKTLELLKKEKYKLAIATNRPRKFTRIILRQLDMNKYFSYVLCADQAGKGKPHPIILKKILKRSFLKPSEALYVGDMLIDIETGKKAGVKTIAVATGATTSKELSKGKPFSVIKKIKDLNNVLKSLEKV